MTRTFYLLTVHPHLVAAYNSCGVFRAAADKNIATIKAINLRDFAVDSRGSVDDSPYGGGEGAVLRVEPIVQAIRALPEEVGVILTSPRGKPWDYRAAQHYASEQRALLFICGRFSGVDQRVVDNFVDASYSIGDFVVAGGELPALMMVDSILRLMPGVLGNQGSAYNDACDNKQRHVPLYTRPREFEGLSVPAPLLSGNPQQVEAWRTAQVECVEISSATQRKSL